MAKPGPKPTPTPMLQLRGSWRGETRDGEPKPEVIVPPCPEWVGEDAKKLWGEIAPMLGGLGIMAEVHGISLTLLVQALADWIEVTKLADAAPKTSPTQGGGEKVHPLQTLKESRWRCVLAACREFGMTPSAISGVRSVKKVEKPKGLAGLKLGT